MEHIRAFCDELERRGAPAMKKDKQFRIYNRSLAPLAGSVFFLARLDSDEKVLIEYAKGTFAGGFVGETVPVGAGRIRVIARTPENTAALRAAFPFTKPISVRDRAYTQGCGDRLGLATPGHVRAARQFGCTPVVAQQSTRELGMTGRTFRGVIDDACWGVFQENFTTGFGGDGDHLKNHGEVQMAIDAGMTVITMDLSEHIDNSIQPLLAEEVAKKYSEIPAEIRRHYENRYLDKSNELTGADGEIVSIGINEEMLARIVLTYHKAIQYAIQINRDLIVPNGMDYEISIDETMTPTDPEAHWVVARELTEAGVEPFSMAPRFCGEFQKGIDYIGDQARFTREFRAHAAIAEKFGYKLSIHSGSDKFSIYPIIGRLSRGRLHHKTSGTSWLQAMRLIAAKAPALYLAIHEYCLANYAQVKKFYHITENAANIPEISRMSEGDYESLFDNPDLRQVIHISYGLVLLTKNAYGGYMFKDDVYKVWDREEEGLYELIESHFVRHHAALGFKRVGIVED